MKITNRLVDIVISRMSITTSIELHLLEMSLNLLLLLIAEQFKLLHYFLSVVYKLIANISVGFHVHILLNDIIDVIWHLSWIQFCVCLKVLLLTLMDFFLQLISPWNRCSILNSQSLGNIVRSLLPVSDNWLLRWSKLLSRQFLNWFLLLSFEIGRRLHYFSR